MTLLTLLYQPPVLLVELYQGAGAVAQRSFTGYGTFGVTADLTPGERALISDWTDLRARVTAYYGPIRITHLFIRAPTGNLLVFRNFASTVSASGNLTRAVFLQAKASSVTPSGTRQSTVQLQAKTSSITPSGSLQKTVQNFLTSSITAVGSLLRLVLKPLNSTVTPAGTLQRTVLKQTFASSITATSAHTIKQIFTKAFSSTITAAGTLQLTVLKPLASTIGLTGVLTRLITILRASAITPAGTLQKTTQKPLASSVGLSGLLTRLVSIPRSSSVTPAGSLQKTTIKAFVSTVAPAGAFQRLVLKPLSSAINLSGIRTFLVRKTMTSSVTPARVVTRQVQISRTSTVALAGTFAKQAAKSFGSSVGLSGVFTSLSQRTISTRRFTVNALARIRTVLARVKAVADPKSVRTLAPAPTRTVAAVTRIRTVQPAEGAMAEIPSFSAKRVDEIDTFTFDFVNQLGVGETLSAPIVMEIAVSTESAVPDAGPSLAVSGVAAISGTKVVQKLQAGLNGATYIVVARVNTNQGRTIECAARLLVKDETA